MLNFCILYYIAFLLLYITPTSSSQTKKNSIFIAISSDHQNHWRRDVARKSWLSDSQLKKLNRFFSMKVSYAFFVNLPAGRFDRVSQLKKLNEEISEYGDIYQIDFSDNDPPARKTQLMIEYACGDGKGISRFFMKIDDDVVLNWSLLVKTLVRVPKDMYMYLGYVIDDKKVEKNLVSESYFSKTSAQEYWDPYALNSGYVISGNCLLMIYRMAQRFIEDDRRPPHEYYVGQLVKSVNEIVKHGKDDFFGTRYIQIINDDKFETFSMRCTGYISYIDKCHGGNWPKIPNINTNEQHALIIMSDKKASILDKSSQPESELRAVNSNHIDTNDKQNNKKKKSSIVSAKSRLRELKKMIKKKKKK